MPGEGVRGNRAFVNASESNTPLGHLLLLIPLSNLAIAFFSRLTQLEARPMHGDEANQAVKAGALLDEGFYRYDPLDHHGPTLYYFSLVSARLFGQRTFIDTSERTFRVVPALFGIGVVGGSIKVVDGVLDRLGQLGFDSFEDGGISVHKNLSAETIS